MIFHRDINVPLRINCNTFVKTFHLLPSLCSIIGLIKQKPTKKKWQLISLSCTFCLPCECLHPHTVQSNGECGKQTESWLCSLGGRIPSETTSPSPFWVEWRTSFLLKRRKLKSELLFVYTHRLRKATSILRTLHTHARVYLNCSHLVKLQSLSCTDLEAQRQFYYKSYKRT